MTTSKRNQSEDNSVFHIQDAVDRAKEKVGVAKVKVGEVTSQVTHDARAKGTHAADEAAGLAHKARETATSAERSSIRRAALPLVSVVGVAAVVVGWIRRRRRSQNRLTTQLKRRLPRR